MNKENLKLFRFSDPRQERIYKRLLLIGPGPAAFYKDACHLMGANLDLASVSHLVAHLFREIDSALRTVLLPYDYTPPPKCSSCDNRPGSHKKQVEAIQRAYGLNDIEPVNLAYLAHRDALSHPRAADGALRQKWNEAEVYFDVLLAKFETSFLRSFPLMDGLLTVSSPSKDDVTKLKNQIPNNPVTLGYFFDKLTSPSWIEPLWKADFFRHPPVPIHDEEQGTVVFAPWPEL